MITDEKGRYVMIGVLRGASGSRGGIPETRNLKTDWTKVSDFTQWIQELMTGGGDTDPGK